MYLSRLELLCEMVRVKSLIKTAKLLSLDPTYLKEQIRSLEEFYGVQIFQTNGEDLSLTEVGQVVLEHAKEILQIHSSLELKIDRITCKEKERLRIGASSVLGNYLMPCSLWSFKERYPYIEVQSVVENADMVLSRLDSGQIDLAILEEIYIRPYTNIVAYPMFRDELMAIAPAKGPWLKRATLSWEQLKKVPLILREQGSGTRKMFEYVVESHGMDVAKLNIVAEFDNVTDIKKAVEAGKGISFCSRIALGKEIRNSKIRPLRLDGQKLLVDYVLAYRDNQELKSAAQRFVRLVADPEVAATCILSGSDEVMPEENTSC